MEEVWRQGRFRIIPLYEEEQEGAVTGVIEVEDKGDGRKFSDKRDSV